MLIYLRTVRSKLTPPAGANPLVLVLSWLLMGLLFVLAVGLGLMFLLVGWILLLPVMWRRRREIKQFWQFSRSAKQAAKAAQQSTSANRNSSTTDSGRVFEGEYRDTSDR
jgi:ABC-type protease/lipase transport system fused ATPase/permease subunit